MSFTNAAVQQGTCGAYDGQRIDRLRSRLGAYDGIVGAEGVPDGRRLVVSEQTDRTNLARGREMQWAAVVADKEGGRVEKCRTFTRCE